MGHLGPWDPWAHGHLGPWDPGSSGCLGPPCALECDSPSLAAPARAEGRRGPWTGGARCRGHSTPLSPIFAFGAGRPGCAGPPAAVGKQPPPPAPCPPTGRISHDFCFYCFYSSAEKPSCNTAVGGDAPSPNPARRGGRLGPLLGHARSWPWPLLSLCSSWEGVHPLPSAG